MAGFPIGYNIYYHESGWSESDSTYRNNYNNMNLSATEKNLFPYRLETGDDNWKMVGDHGATGGYGYTISSPTSGCTITMLSSSVNGSIGYYPGEDTNVHHARMTGNYNEGFFELYEQAYKANFSITKVDSITNEKLSGATFALDQWNGSSYAFLTNLTESSTGIYTYSNVSYTNTNQGKFRVREVRAPNSYTNSNWSKEFTISTTSSTLTQTFSATVSNEPYKIRAKAIKVDANTNNKLNGAIFTVYAWNGSSYTPYIRNGTTVTLLRQSDNTYLSDWLYYNKSNQGKFRIIETTTPTGYIGDYNSSNQKRVYDLTISSSNTNSTVTVSNASNGTFQNSRVKGKINVSIIDSETRRALAQGDATLQGAVYGLFAREPIIHSDGTTGTLYSANDLVARGTIENFALTFENLELGKYYIKQITPSEGYKVDETKYNVDLLYQNESVRLIEKNVTVEEVVKKQAFQLIKVGNSGDNTELDVLMGSGFKIYLISSLKGIQNGTITPNPNGSYNASSFIGYDFSNDTTALDFSNNSQGENIPEAFTDNRGYLQSRELAYGEYVVIESTVPENYIAITPFFVNIIKDDRTPQNWRVFLDREINARISVVKKDATSGLEVLNKNAKYRIYNETTKTYVEQPITYPEHMIVGTLENPFEIDSSGNFTTPLTLSVGNYELQEVTAPEAYVLTGFEGKSSNGVYTATPKNSIKFEISSNSALKMDPLTGDAYVLVEQYNDRQVGSLTINATGDILSNAILQDNGYDFEYTNLPIQGAVFEVFANEDILSPDNQGVVLYEKYEKIAILTTNSEGKVILDNLPLGKYYIQQITAGEGFALNTETKEFEMTYGGQEVAVVYADVEYINERQKVKIIVNKTDKDTGNAISGAVFGLYLKEDLTYMNSTIKANELIQTATSNDEGIIIFENDLPLGNYYIKEIKAPYGYITDLTEIDIDATYMDDQRAVIVKTIDFTNTKTSVNFIVKDYETNIPLSGMGLLLKDNDGNIVNSWITGENGEYLIRGLEPNKVYTVVENIIKTGYTENVLINNDVSDLNELFKTEIENEQITFTVTDSPNIQTVTLKNRAKVSDINVILQGEVLKDIITDEYGNTDFVYELDNLEGGNFEIYTKEDIIHPDGTTGVIIPAGVKIATFVTDKNGKLITNVEENIISDKPDIIKSLLERGIPLGKYEVKQTKAPTGYYRNPELSTKELDIVYENPVDEVQHIEVIFENERQRVNLGQKYSSVKITKTADKTVYKSNEVASYTILVTNDGEVTLRDVDVTETLLSGKFVQKDGITALENNKVRIPELKVGETIELKYICTIPQDLNGKLHNIVCVTGKPILPIIDEDGNPIEKELPPVYDEDDEDIFVGTGNMLLLKDSDDSKYIPGSTIKYSITVANPTDYEMVDIKLTDTLKGIVFEEKDGLIINNDGTAIISSIPARQSFEFSYTYVIPEDFVGTKINNKISANGILKIKPNVIPDDPDIPGNPDDPSTPPAPLDVPVNGTDEHEVLVGKSKLKITKETQKSVYKIGDKVVYTIKVSNVGKAKITNLVIKDSLGTGIFKESFGVVLENGVAKIAELDVGKTITLFYEYIIPESKLNGEKIDNIVTVTGTGIIENEENPGNPIIEDLEDSDTAQITIEKDNSGLGLAGICKLDVETKQPLEGAIFELYVKDDIIVNGKVIAKKDTFVERAISGKNGFAYFKADLSLGNYYVLEVQPPKKYTKDDERIEIDASTLDESEKVINVVMEKENQKTAVVISKFEIGKTEEIPGTKFKIIDEDGNIIESWTTGNSASLIRGLETNKKYTLIEVEPAPGYVTATPIEFSLDDYGVLKTDNNNILEGTKIQTIVMKDDITRLEVSVIDKYTKEPVIGAVVQIVDKNTGNIVETWVSDGTIHTVEKLPIGDYELVQTKAPTEQGYVISDKIDFSIKDTNEIHKVVMEEDITKLEVSLVDALNKELLPDGVLEIRNENNEVVSIIDNTSKKFYVERLPVGKYTLVETTTPGGYRTANTISFEIKETNKVHYVIMENDRLPFDFKVDKWVSSIKINNETKPGNTFETKDKIIKIDIASKKIKSEKIKITYKIRVSNIGEVEGSVGKVIDEIPGGFEFIASDNPTYWKVDGQQLICTDYENKTLKPNETFELDVILTWINADNNFGIRTNVARLDNFLNPYGFEDINENNNRSEAQAILSIKTGLEYVLLKHAGLIVATELLVISLFVIIELKILRKKS